MKSQEAISLKKLKEDIITVETEMRGLFFSKVINDDVVRAYLSRLRRWEDLMAYTHKRDKSYLCDEP